MAQRADELRPAPAALRTIAGIDEAGLGPLLGPLTLGYSVFRVPARGVDLWKRLASCVSPDPKDDADKLVVADSKRVFTRNPRGARRLESAVLGFLAQRAPGRDPRLAPRALLFGGALAPPPDVVAAHPWYRLLPPLAPLAVGADGLELRAERLHRALAAARTALVDAGVRVVPAGELNASFHATGSKGLTLWEKTQDVLRHLWTAHAADGLTTVVDRHGARARYGSLLARTFPEAAVRLLVERDGRSEYELAERAGPRSMRVIFAERGEELAFPTALASCLAKYARELCMGAFNAYFGALQDDLRPTAGYTTDGRRWVRDATPALQRSGVPRERVERSR